MKSCRLKAILVHTALHRNMYLTIVLSISKGSGGPPCSVEANALKKQMSPNQQAFLTKTKSNSIKRLSSGWQEASSVTQEQWLTTSLINHTDCNDWQEGSSVTQIAKQWWSWPKSASAVPLVLRHNLHWRASLSRPNPALREEKKKRTLKMPTNNAAAYCR